MRLLKLLIVIVVFDNQSEAKPDAKFLSLANNRALSYPQWRPLEGTHYLGTGCFGVPGVRICPTQGFGRPAMLGRAQPSAPIRRR